MESKRKNFKITVTWWYNEKGQHAFTTIYCDEEIIDAVLFHYTNIEVKEIVIEEVETISNDRTNVC